MNEHLAQRETQQSTWKRKFYASMAAVGLLLGAGKIATGSEGVPCDPVIDNECIIDPNDPDGTLPTLPEKEATTTTTEPPIETTTTTVVSQPPNMPPIIVEIPPAAPPAPPIIVEAPPVVDIPTGPAAPTT